LSISPFGIGRQKPHHYREMLRIAWENRDQLPFAWRILRDGVCDGCALGTSGLSDWTLPGTHLCMVRLELMRLNTAPELDVRQLSDVASLRSLSSAELRALGRLPQPMLRRQGEAGFLAISWDSALDRIAAEIRRTDPQRIAFYLTSRGVTNETYYAAQKAARFIGSPHVDNAARLCHAASTAAMKRTLGHGASTCSYADWVEADLIVLFGSNVANNQPVAVKYLAAAKERGATIVVVNPFREPGLDRYWVPSQPKSAFLGTQLADRWVDVHTGGDRALLVGLLKALIETGGVDDDYVREQTVGFEAVRAEATASSWDAIAAESGVPHDDITQFAALLVAKPNAVFIWSMGLTQHAHGVETVAALVNLGLARGLPGRPRRGLVPIRGHSGVQGGAEVGCVPVVDEATATRWSRVWEFPVSASAGWTAPEMIDHAAAGDVDLFWMLGGNFLETMADHARSARALQRPRLRIHHDIVVSSAMLADADGDVLLLPAATRYESEGGGTETSTERRIIFSPQIPGRRIGGARPEWWAFAEAMARVWPNRANDIRFESAAAIRQEIARAVPLYAGIERLAAKGDQIQWGGRTLFSDGRFATPDGKAHFVAIGSVGGTISPPAPFESFRLSTRRGKQFNSMVQRDVDPLTGADRDDILISGSDADGLGLAERQRVRLRSADGAFEGRIRRAAIKPGNLEVHWPEGNVLLSGAAIDLDSMEPDFNARVVLERL
jgi:molybdopterin-dependent oxidoreductase alpha subunit